MPIRRAINEFARIKQLAAEETLKSVFGNVNETLLPIDKNRDSPSTTDQVYIDENNSVNILAGYVNELSFFKHYAECSGNIR